MTPPLKRVAPTVTTSARLEDFDFCLRRRSQSTEIICRFKNVARLLTSGTPNYIGAMASDDEWAIEVHVAVSASTGLPAGRRDHDMRVLISRHRLRRLPDFRLLTGVLLGTGLAA